MFLNSVLCVVKSGERQDGFAHTASLSLESTPLQLQDTEPFAIRFAVGRWSGHVERHGDVEKERKTRVRIRSTTPVLLTGKE